jgi:hypothetical protein
VLNERFGYMVLIFVEREYNLFEKTFTGLVHVCVKYEK